MAVLQFYPVASASVGTAAAPLYSNTLGAAGNSVNITTGFDMLIRIVASGPIAIRFGASATLTNAGTGDIYIPANIPDIWDMGHLNNAINIYSFNASTVVNVTQVQKN